MVVCHRCKFSKKVVCFANTVHNYADLECMHAFSRFDALEEQGQFSLFPQVDVRQSFAGSEVHSLGDVSHIEVSEIIPCCLDENKNGFASAF